MAKLTTDQLLDAFKELTLIELSEFVKAFEETFEVTAAAPLPLPPPAPELLLPSKRSRRRTRSTSSSSRPARRRSRSSRRCAHSPASAWVRRRLLLTAPPAL